MAHAARWPLIQRLVLHAEDVDDHNIPKMIWFGLEPLVPERPDKALELARTSKIPILIRHIARRLTDAGQLSTVVNAIEQSEDANVLLLLGMRDGLEGRFDVKAPENWSRVYEQLKSRDRFGISGAFRAGTELRLGAKTAFLAMGSVGWVDFGSPGIFATTDVTGMRLGLRLGLRVYPDG